MELSNLKLKKLLIFQEELPKLEKSKILYLLFVERELFKYKYRRKMKKIILKNVLYFEKLNFQTSSLKNFLYFRRNFQSLKNQKFHIFCLL